MKRKIITAILAAIGLTAAAQICNVSGTITGMPGKRTGYVLRLHPKMARDTIATFNVNNGRFTFTLNGEKLNEAYELDISDNPARPVFFAEKGNVNITGADKTFFFSKATGTRANADWAKHRANMSVLGRQRGKEIDALDKLNIQKEEKEKRRAKILESYNKKYVDIVDKINADGLSLAALYYYWDLMNNFSPDDIDLLLKKFKPQMQSMRYYKALAKRAATLRSVAEGVVAPDFTALTPDGNSITLSDLRGKYVVLDFWASWCHPCRAEGKNLKAVYGQLQGKPFEILSVSSDKNEDAWRKAMEEDGMTWKQGLLKGDNLKKVYGLYGITGIPAIWIIDPEGKIIAKQPRGEKLKQFCLDLFQ